MALPKQASRETDALRKTIAENERKRTTHAPIDGEGRHITGIAIASTASYEVVHQLGRQHRGWFVSRLRGASAGACFPPIETAATGSSFTLENIGGDDITFDLWVF